MAEVKYDPAKSKRVIVIGGGLSGLAAAHRIHERSAALRRPVELTVLEARERVGGVIATERQDGFTLECGPDSFITNKPWGLDLCERLGLRDRLIETDPGQRRSFVVRKGRLLPVPEGFVLMAPHRLGPILTTPVLSWRGKLRMLMDLFIPRRDDEAEESLAGFVRRRLGREALDRLVQPLVGGHLHGRPQRPEPQGHAAAVPGDGARAPQPDPGGPARGAAARPRPAVEAGLRARYGMFVALDDGMGELPAALAAALPPGTIRTGFGRPPDHPQRAGLALAGRAARRPADRGRRRGPGDRGPRRRPLDRRPGPRPGPPAPRDPLCVVDHRQRRLPPRPDPAPARRLRRRRAGHRGPVDPGGLVPERQVPQPGPGRHGAAARLHRRRDPARVLRPRRRGDRARSSAASWAS